MYDYHCTKPWRVSFTVPGTANAQLVKWARQVTSYGGHYCPDDYKQGSFSWLYDNQDSAQNVVSALTEDTTIRCGVQNIALQAPLAAMLNLEVTVDTFTVKGNIVSDWFPDVKRVFSPDLSDGRLLEILKRSDCVVARFAYSENSYGEFWFIDLMHKHQLSAGESGRFGPYHMQFYGHGENWNSGLYVGYWKHVVTNQYLRGAVEPLEKEAVIKKIESLAATAPKKQRPQTETQRLYSILADFIDEDGALAEMQDQGFEF